MTKTIEHIVREEISRRIQVTERFHIKDLPVRLGYNEAIIPSLDTRVEGGLDWMFGVIYFLTPLPLLALIGSRGKSIWAPAFTEEVYDNVARCCLQQIIPGKGFQVRIETSSKRLAVTEGRRFRLERYEEDIMDITGTVTYFAEERSQ